MPTKLALVALAVTATTIAGCGDSKAAGDAAASPSAAVSAAPAGNGVAALSADEILQKSKDALKAAKSFKVTGVMSENGEKTDVDMHINGSDFAGTMTTGAATLAMVSINGKKYMKPNEAFWVMSTDAKQGKALNTAVNGRWIGGADGDAQMAGIFAIGSVDGMFKPTGAISKGEEKVIAGVPAIGLNDAGDAGTVLWIATTGEPYPLEIANKDGSTLVVGAVGEPATGIVAPAAAQVVDMNKLKGK